MDSNNDERKGRGNRENFGASLEDGSTGRDGEVMTDKESLFVKYYSEIWDATKAAKLAGYSAKSAGSTGYSLLQKEKIQEALQVYRKVIANDFRKTHEALAAFYMRVMTTNMEDLFDQGKDGEIKLKKGALKSAAGIMIDQISITKNGVSIKVFSKQAAAEMLNRHVGFYEIDNDQRKPTGVGIFLPDNGRGDGPANPS